MQLYLWAFLIFLVILIFFYQKKENYFSPGYNNRYNVSVHLDQTYGGKSNLKEIRMDPRFAP